MPRANRYEIIDEPGPGRFAHLTVSPLFPLFGCMVAGAWLGWTWMAFNSYAFGSATRKRELAIALLAPCAVLASLLGIGYLGNTGILSKAALPYAVLVLSLIKLASMYWLFNLQQRSFALYEYFAGQKRNGALVLVAGALLGRTALEQVPVVLRLVLQ